MGCIGNGDDISSVLTFGRLSCPNGELLTINKYGSSLPEKNQESFVNFLYLFHDEE
jgi:hypothetical protein